MDQPWDRTREDVLFALSGQAPSAGIWSRCGAFVLVSGLSLTGGQMGELIHRTESNRPCDYSGRKVLTLAGLATQE